MFRSLRTKQENPVFNTLLHYCKQLKQLFCCILQSDPTYVPIKLPERNDRSSGTESDDCSVSRSVRFSKLAEVSKTIQLCIYYYITLFFWHSKLSLETCNK